jgi:MoaA/NifB/PqqE/SkfB family radical SAM enzyme
MNKYVYFIRLAAIMMARRQINYSRTKNLVKALWNYYRKDVQPDTYPVVVAIDPIEACNLGCFICPIGRKDKKLPSPMLNFNDYSRLIDEMKDYIAMLVLYVNGEPFLHPRFLDMVEYAHSKQINILASTNGHFSGQKRESAERLVNSGLDHLIVTISGATQETYVQYHKNGNLDKVLSNVRRIIETRKRLKRKTPFLTIRYLKFAYNLHEMELARRIAKEIGVDDIVFREARVVFSDEKGTIYNEERRSDYMESFVPQESQRAGRDKAKKCAWPWLIGIINANGEVPVCTQYSYISNPGDENKVGDLPTGGSFKDIWLGEGLVNVRRAISEGRQPLSFCQGCLRGVGFGDAV